MPARVETVRGCFTDDHRKYYPALPDRTLRRSLSVSGPHGLSSEFEVPSPNQARMLDLFTRGVPHPKIERAAVLGAAQGECRIVRGFAYTCAETPHTMFTHANCSFFRKLKLACPTGVEQSGTIFLFDALRACRYYR